MKKTVLSFTTMLGCLFLALGCAPGPAGILPSGTETAVVEHSIQVAETIEDNDPSSNRLGPTERPPLPAELDPHPEPCLITLWLCLGSTPEEIPTILSEECHQRYREAYERAGGTNLPRHTWLECVGTDEEPVLQEPERFRLPREINPLSPNFDSFARIRLGPTHINSK